MGREQIAKNNKEMQINIILSIKKTKFQSNCQMNKIKPNSKYKKASKVHIRRKIRKVLRDHNKEIDLGDLIESVSISWLVS